MPELEGFKLFVMQVPDVPVPTICGPVYIKYNSITQVSHANDSPNVAASIPGPTRVNIAIFLVVVELLCLQIPGAR